MGGEGDGRGAVGEKAAWTVLGVALGALAGGAWSLNPAADCGGETETWADGSGTCLLLLLRG